LKELNTVVELEVKFFYEGTQAKVKEALGEGEVRVGRGESLVTGRSGEEGFGGVGGVGG